VSPTGTANTVLVPKNNFQPHPVIPEPIKLFSERIEPIVIKSLYEESPVSNNNNSQAQPLPDPIKIFSERIEPISPSTLQSIAKPIIAAMDNNKSELQDNDNVVSMDTERSENASKELYDKGFMIYEMEDDEVHDVLNLNMVASQHALDSPTQSPLMRFIEASDTTENKENIPENTITPKSTAIHSIQPVEEMVTEDCPLLDEWDVDQHVFPNINSPGCGSSAASSLKDYLYDTLDRSNVARAVTGHAGNNDDDNDDDDGNDDHNYNTTNVMDYDDDDISDKKPTALANNDDRAKLVDRYGKKVVNDDDNDEDNDHNDDDDTKATKLVPPPAGKSSKNNMVSARALVAGKAKEKVSPNAGGIKSKKKDKKRSGAHPNVTIRNKKQKKELILPGKQPRKINNQRMNKTNREAIKQLSMKQKSVQDVRDWEEPKLLKNYDPDGKDNDDCIFYEPPKDRQLLYRRHRLEELKIDPNFDKETFVLKNWHEQYFEGNNHKVKILNDVALDIKTTEERLNIKLKEERKLSSKAKMAYDKQAVHELKKIRKDIADLNIELQLKKWDRDRVKFFHRSDAIYSLRVDGNIEDENSWKFWAVYMSNGDKKFYELQVCKEWLDENFDQDFLNDFLMHTRLGDYFLIDKNVYSIYSKEKANSYFNGNNKKYLKKIWEYRKKEDDDDVFLSELKLSFLQYQ
jgi:hypothetical protein